MMLWKASFITLTMHVGAMAVHPLSTNPKPILLSANPKPILLSNNPKPILKGHQLYN